VNAAPVPPTPPTTSLPQTIVEVEQGDVRSGYLVITPDTNSSAPLPTVTFGTVQNGVVQSQAGIIASPLLLDALMFVDVIPAIGRNLGLAIVNPSDANSVVTLVLKDERSEERR